MEFKENMSKIQSNKWCCPSRACERAKAPVIHKHLSCRKDRCLPYESIPWITKGSTITHTMLLCVSMFFLLILLHLFKKLILFKYSWFTVFCSFLLYSKVLQLYMFLYIIFHILFHYDLLQGLEYIVPHAIQ